MVVTSAPSQPFWFLLDALTLQIPSFLSKMYRPNRSDSALRRYQIAFSIFLKAHFHCRSGDSPRDVSFFSSSTLPGMSMWKKRAMLLDVFPLANQGCSKSIVMQEGLIGQNEYKISSKFALHGKFSTI